MSFPVALASRLQAISFDVDGVLTNGSITYTDDGRELKTFNVQDGAATKLLINAGIHVAWITGRSSAMVSRRAKELGVVHLYQGNEQKTAAFDDFLVKVGVPAEQTAHVGDDLPDLVLFDRAALGISVPNGHPDVQRAAAWITETRGGDGVVSEIARLVLKAQAKWSY